MNIAFCRIDSLKELLNYYHDLHDGNHAKTKSELFRIIMSKDTHRILTKLNDVKFTGDVKEFTKIYGVRVLFDDDIPIGKCEIFIRASDVFNGIANKPEIPEEIQEHFDGIRKESIKE